MSFRDFLRINFIVGWVFVGGVEDILDKVLDNLQHSAQNMFLNN